MNAFINGLSRAGLVPLVLTASSAFASTGVIGEARDVGDGGFLYSEHHSCSQDGAQCTVDYKDGSGEVFARKAVDYVNGMHSPTLVLEDFRSEQVRRLDGDYGEGVVVDAGFDHYVRYRWEELAAGEEIKFPFLIVGRDKPLAMSARLDEDRQCDSEQLCLVVTLDMWLIALLVDPIQLVYDDQRRLTQFRGVSNIPTDEGKPQSVEINYRYLVDPAASRDL